MERRDSQLSKHIFSPGEIVVTWHSAKMILMDPIVLPMNKGDWRSLEFRQNEGYKGTLIPISYEHPFRVVRQIGQVFKNVDHMTERMVASYILQDGHSRRLFYQAVTSNYLVKIDEGKAMSDSHSWNMSE